MKTDKWLYLLVGCIVLSFFDIHPLFSFALYCGVMLSIAGIIVCGISDKPFDPDKEDDHF